MLTRLPALLLLLGASLSAAPIVKMHILGSLASPGFYLFDVNGEARLTLCDQFNPEITTEPYMAQVATLADLTGTVLQKQGDPQALQKYQKLGILASLAFQDPSRAGDVTRAMRSIVDGHAALTSAALDLLDWLQTQDPAKYSQTLSQFMIYTPVLAPGFILDSQEQVAYLVPEPGTILWVAFGLVILVASHKKASTTA